MGQNESLLATGRRKTSIARVLLRQGEGKILINKRTIDEYFGGSRILKEMVYEPLRVTNFVNKFDILINVRGGGISSQCGAIRLGVSRAIARFDESLRKALKKAGLLTRDPRMVERKKPGLAKARKRFQWTKR